MKIIDLHHILYPMVTYDSTTHSQAIHYGRDSDLIVCLSKNDCTAWCIDLIEKGIPQEYSLFFKNEYLACIGFLKFTNKIISDNPNEMKVLDCSEGTWYLLDKKQEFCFYVQYDLHHYNYSWNMKLSLEELIDYRLNGRKSLDQLAQVIYLSEPFYEDSIFYFRKLSVRQSTENEAAIIKYNQKKTEYIKKNYKKNEEMLIPINTLQMIHSKKISFLFVYILTIIVGWVIVESQFNPWLGD